MPFYAISFALMGAIEVKRKKLPEAYRPDWPFYCEGFCNFSTGCLIVLEEISFDFELLSFPLGDLSPLVSTHLQDLLKLFVCKVLLQLVLNKIFDTVSRTDLHC